MILQAVPLYWAIPVYLVSLYCNLRLMNTVRLKNFDVNIECALIIFPKDDFKESGIINNIKPSSKRLMLVSILHNPFHKRFIGTYQASRDSSLINCGSTDSYLRKTIKYDSSSFLHFSNHQLVTILKSTNPLSSWTTPYDFSNDQNYSSFFINNNVSFNSYNSYQSPLVPTFYSEYIREEPRRDPGELFNHDAVSREFSDISTEERYVPKGFNAPRPLKKSPAITTLSITGWSKPNIDTFGPERNKIYSYNTPTEIQRRAFWEYLLQLSDWRNDHKKKTMRIFQSEETDSIDEKGPSNEDEDVDEENLIQNDPEVIINKTDSFNWQTNVQSYVENLKNSSSIADLISLLITSKYAHPPTPMNSADVTDELKAQFLAFKSMGKVICREIPTPQRKLESFRHQESLRNFYRQRYDNEYGQFDITVCDLLDRQLMPDSSDVLCSLIIRDGIVDYNLTNAYNGYRSLVNGNGSLLTSDSSHNYKGLFFGSWFDPELDAIYRYIIADDVRFVPEYSNYNLRNTQRFHRGQIGHQSRKYDNDFPIFDYRKFDFGMSKFYSLNLFGMNDICCVIVPTNFESNLVLHLLFLYTSADDLVDPEKESFINYIGNKPEKGEKNDEKVSLQHFKPNPILNSRLLIYLQENSKLKIYQSNISFNKNQQAFINSSVRIHLNENCHIQHFYSQELGSNVFHIENISVKSAPKSRYELTTISLGAKASRLNLQVEGSPNSSQKSRGIGLVHRDQETLKYEMFHHNTANITTDQLHKYIVADEGMGIWRGRVRIERAGVKACADTLCRVLLLNYGAKCITIPTLEIIPADVIRATHGAAISHLEEDSIYYFLSRGIDVTTARNILMQAFVEEIYAEFPDPQIKLRTLRKLKSMVPMCMRKLGDLGK